MRSVQVSLLLLLSLLSSTAWSQETYDLKTRTEAQGDTVRLDILNTFQMDISVELGGESKKIRELKSTETMVFTEKILAKKAGEKATRIHREYEKAQIDDGKEKKTLSFQGKKILVERKETGFEFQFEGGDEIEGEAAEYLKIEFNQNDDLVEPDRLLRPKKPVKVGETWDLEIAAIAKNYARTTPVPLDQAKARGQGKLTKIYPKDGRNWGVIEVEIVIPLKPGPQGALDVDASSKMTLKQVMDGPIDGRDASKTFESTMTLDIVGQLDIGQGRIVKQVMKGQGKFRAQATDLAKKP